MSCYKKWLLLHSWHYCDDKAHCLILLDINIEQRDEALIRKTARPQNEFWFFQKYVDCISVYLTNFNPTIMLKFCNHEENKEENNSFTKCYGILINFIT